MGYRLKALPPGRVEQAIAKAAHYRALNQPDEAESICLDVLDVEPAHQEARRLLGLAITDRFGFDPEARLEGAVAVFERLHDEYDRVYHLGVAWERSGKAHAKRGEGHNAVSAIEHALPLYERAAQLRPDSPDPVLRWNRCVRLLEGDAVFRAALKDPRDEGVRFGD